MGIAVYFATALMVLVLAIPLVRVVKGPSVFDRLLGAGVIGTKIVTLILLLGVLYGRLDMFIDIALAYAILNFIGAIVIAKYMRVQGAGSHESGIQKPGTQKPGTQKEGA